MTKTLVRRMVLLGVGMVLGLGAEFAEAQTLEPGRGVSIDVVVGPEGALVADDVEVLPQPRSFSLRGKLEALDPLGGSLALLGISVTLDSLRSEVVTSSGVVPVSRLGEWAGIGDWVEVKAKLSIEGPDTAWVAREIEVVDVKPSPTVKGTIADVRRFDVAAAEYTVTVDGLLILIVAATDFEQESDPVFEELFGEQKSEDSLGDNPEYRINVGGRVFLSGSVRPSARFEDSYQLQDNAEDLVGVGESSFRLEALAVLTPNATVFAQVKNRGSYELYKSADVPGEVPRESLTQLRQFYLSWREVAGQPLGVVVGKQRVRDEREFLFDEYLDGARLYLYRWRPFVLEASLFVPVAPVRERFETWRDVFVQGRYFIADDWHARAFTLSRFDSDSERNRNSRYVGVAVDGDQGPLKAWASVTRLMGEDKGRRQSATAWDVGGSVRTTRLPGRPSLTLGAATGSGDHKGGDAVSEEFRQTGYEDNSSRLWGLSSFKHYGEVLDPELSNLRVLTVGFGVRSARRVSVDVIAHQFRQDIADSEFDRVDLHTPDEVLNGDDPEVGTEVDVVLAVQDVFAGLAFAYKFGVFRPGPAFESDGHFAILHRIELRIGF